MKDQCMISVKKRWEEVVFLEIKFFSRILFDEAWEKPKVEQVYIVQSLNFLQVLFYLIQTVMPKFEISQQRKRYRENRLLY